MRRLVTQLCIKTIAFITLINTRAITLDAVKFESHNNYRICNENNLN